MTISVTTQLDNILLWLPRLAALAHIFEEFVWPAGFAEWYQLLLRDSNVVEKRDRILALRAVYVDADR